MHRVRHGDSAGSIEYNAQKTGKEFRLFMNFTSMFHQRPMATAELHGSAAYPDITGTVLFFQMREGVLVATEAFGLPSPDGPCAWPVFGFHIHSGGQCGGNETDPFAGAMTHYNPKNCAHPAHAGDLPPLFGNGGHAVSAVLTDRFTVREIIGKTVIVHVNRDDFSTQPSGDSGTKIACGRIEANGIW